MTDYAKPCPTCGMYYPGDCRERGCQDELCACDGCMSYDPWMWDDDDN